MNRGDIRLGLTTIGGGLGVEMHSGLITGIFIRIILMLILG